VGPYYDFNTIDKDSSLWFSNAAIKHFLQNLFTTAMISNYIKIFHPADVKGYGPYSLL
jgi:hypothetical protein